MHTKKRRIDIFYLLILFQAIILMYFIFANPVLFQRFKAIYPSIVGQYIIFICFRLLVKVSSKDKYQENLSFTFVILMGFGAAFSLSTQKELSGVLGILYLVVLLIATKQYKEKRAFKIHNVPKAWFMGYNLYLLAVLFFLYMFLIT